jgi:hypothetical protein
MATAFVITTATNTVLLGPDRSGTASFTVTNQTGRAVLARSTLVAIDPTQAGWLTLGGTAERNYPIGGTEQITVSVTVPPEAAEGRYPFRLDVVSVVLPDEDWAQGPVVAFEVPATPDLPPVIKPPPAEPRGYRETLLGAFGGAVPLGGIGVALGIIVWVTSDTSGNDPGSDLGSVIGALIGALILGTLVAFLGMWIGSTAGAGLLLRARHFREPWRTALPIALLFPIWTIAVFVILLNLADAIGIDSGPLGLIVALLAAAISIAGPALAGRAWARWRMTGGL